MECNLREIKGFSQQLVCKYLCSRFCTISEQLTVIQPLKIVFQSEGKRLYLLYRCGIKASGKISWEYFLSKFQTPLGHHNGQTIPIKPSHK